MEPVAPREHRLLDYLDIARHRRSTIALVAGVVIVVGVLVTLLQPKAYEASAAVVLEARAADPLEVANSYVDPKVATKTEAQVFTSDPVLQAVKARLGRVEAVKVVPLADTPIIRVRGRARRAARAAQIANAYADAYVSYRKTTAVEDLLSAGKELEVRIERLQEQADALEGTPSIRQRDSVVAQIAVLRARVDQLQTAASFRTAGARVVNRAGVPDTPVSPRPRRNLAASIVVGLLLGAAVAFILERLDNVVRRPEDVEGDPDGSEVLALVPTVPAWKNRPRPVASAHGRGSSTAEAFRALRVALQSMANRRPLKSVVITSPTGAEGKTTTVVNLALAMAHGGQRVIVIDCDLRRPSLAESFGLANEVGLTSVLNEDATIADALQAVAAEPRLRVLTAGPPIANPSDALSLGIGRVLADLGTHGDVVVLDAPPVAPVSDALALASRVDGTLLVVAAGLTRRADLAAALRSLRRVDASVAGVVLNRAEGRPGNVDPGLAAGGEGRRREPAAHA